MSLRVLLAFPESDYKKEIIYNFSGDPNYELTICKNIQETLNTIRKRSFDIALIDMRFSDGTGLDLRKQMSEIKDIPTLVISNVNEDIKKVLALEYGADDYVVAPFNMLEIKARIRAILRRCMPEGEKTSAEQEHIISLGRFEFNIVGRKVKMSGKAVDLTGKEFDLLYIMVSNPGVVYSREQLSEKLWGKDFKTHLRTVDVHIKRLREKINDHKSRVIRTKWGEGYFYQGDTI